VGAWSAEEILRGIGGFEWDEQKAKGNLQKHRIDFDEATELFYGAPLLRRSDRNDEERWIAVGESEGRLVTVVFTRRGDTIRIISARRARKDEERTYHQAALGRAAEGQD
jgi:uncharacterized DUF497 family protein